VVLLERVIGLELVLVHVLGFNRDGASRLVNNVHWQCRLEVSLDLKYLLVIRRRQLVLDHLTGIILVQLRDASTLRLKSRGKVI